VKPITLRPGLRTLCVQFYAQEFLTGKLQLHEIKDVDPDPGVARSGLGPSGMQVATCRLYRSRMTPQEF